jgi:hypothetical protein
MSVVFADAFYFVARLNGRDQHHDRIVAFSPDFPASMLTTDWVLMEVADVLAKSECRLRGSASSCFIFDRQRHAKLSPPPANYSIAPWNYITSMWTKNGR